METTEVELEEKERIELTSVVFSTKFYRMLLQVLTIHLPSDAITMTLRSGLNSSRKQRVSTWITFSVEG